MVSPADLSPLPATSARQARRNEVDAREVAIHPSSAAFEPRRSPATIPALNARVVACERCPRLRTYCGTIAREKRRAYRDHTYWGLPVPAFGDPQARVLLLGLAPGAHGSNRTGRPFTGDGSGAFLYPLLWESGFASQPNAVSRDDGMQLRDLLITSVVRCAPPDNKPSGEEVANCSPYLDEELALLERLQVVVALGKIAFDGYTTHLLRTKRIPRRSAYIFTHGAEYTLPGGGFLVATYHPSLQNTNTGRLTAPMLLRVLHRARTLAGIDKVAKPPRTRASSPATRASLGKTAGGTP